MYACVGEWQVRSVHPTEGYGWPVGWAPHEQYPDVPHTELLPKEVVQEIVAQARSSKEAITALRIAVRMVTPRVPSPR